MGVGLTILKKLENLVRDVATGHGIPIYKVEAGVVHHSQPGGAGLELPVIRIISYLENDAPRLAAALNAELDLARIVPETNNDPLNAVQYLAALKPNRAELLEYRAFNGRKFTIEMRSMIQDTWTRLERHLGYDTADLPDSVKRELFRISTLLEMADKELARLNQPDEQVAPDNIATIAAAEAYTSAAITIASANPAIADKRARTTPTPVTVVAPQKTDIAEGQLKEPPATATTEVKEPEGTYIVTPTSSANGGHYELNGNGISGHASVNENSSDHTNDNRHLPAAHETALAHSGHKLYENIVDDQAVLTYASLRDFVKSSTLLKEIDSRIAAQAGARLNDDIDIDGDMERLNFLQVYTLKQLHEKLAANKLEMIAYAEKWIGRDNGGSFDSGIGLFYLEYVLVAQRNDNAYATEYVLKFIADNDYTARYIIPTYTSIKTTDKQYVAHRYL